MQQKHSASAVPWTELNRLKLGGENSGFGLQGKPALTLRTPKEFFRLSITFINFL
jgi:hypothetical protein